MRATLIAALVAIVAAAPPPITKTEVVQVYKTVYEDGTAVETPAPEAAPQWGNDDDDDDDHWGYGGGSWDESPAPEAVPETVPEAAPVEEAPSSYAPQPPASAAPSYGGQPTSPDYQEACLQHHNAHRVNHTAEPLVWDAALAATAQKIASSCVYAHDTSTDGGGYGQNIAAGAPASNVSSVLTELFYNNEIGFFDGLYGEPTPSSISDAASFDKYGHYTQMIWKSTTHLGCATFDCSGRGLANTGGNVPAHFTVCNYKPAGNFLGEFHTNVGAPLGHPSISWAST